MRHIASYGTHRLLIGLPAADVEAHSVATRSHGVAHPVVAVRRTGETARRPEQFTLLIQHFGQLRLLVLGRLRSFVTLWEDDYEEEEDE